MRYKPGTKLVFTPSFLESFGERATAPKSRVYTVQRCSCLACTSGRRIAVDEIAFGCDSTKPDFDACYALEVSMTVGNHWRHVSAKNLAPRQ